MGLNFAKRTAARLLNRGASAVKINPNAVDEAKKAITRDDIRKMIKDKSIYATQAKKNKSVNAKILKMKRDEGRRRGPGKRKGTRKARGGMSWEKKVRSQRLLLKELKDLDRMDNALFNKFYGLINGNSFPDKASLLRKLAESGVKVSAEEMAKINENARNRYK